jgi:hypothetical protein
MEDGGRRRIEKKASTNTAKDFVSMVLLPLGENHLPDLSNNRV